MWIGSARFSKQLKRRQGENFHSLAWQLASLRIGADDELPTTVARCPLKWGF